MGRALSRVHHIRVWVCRGDLLGRLALFLLLDLGGLRLDLACDQSECASGGKSAMVSVRECRGEVGCCQCSSVSRLSLFSPYS